MHRCLCIVCLFVFVYHVFDVVWFLCVCVVCCVCVCFLFVVDVFVFVCVYCGCVVCSLLRYRFVL